MAKKEKTRLTRAEAAQFIGCSDTKLWQLTKNGLLDGTYYTIGCRKIFIVEKLKEWMANGGELGAYERKNNLIPLPHIEVVGKRGAI